MPVTKPICRTVWKFEPIPSLLSSLSCFFYHLYYLSSTFIIILIIFIINFIVFIIFFVMFIILFIIFDGQEHDSKEDWTKFCQDISGQNLVQSSLLPLLTGNQEERIEPSFAT